MLRELLDLTELLSQLMLVKLCVVLFLKERVDQNGEVEIEQV